MNQEEILVSVLCTTYNHEKYIRDCLEGFVTQKTNFAYEVIVHDDASTDCTADIIREYERKYPKIIKPIFQTENQYSQGVPITATFILPIVRGRFIALCEGDDYWTSPDKLQKQVEGMLMHPSCSMCVHKVAEVNEDKTPTGVSFPSTALTSGVMSPERFYEIGKEYSFHTSSYCVRTDFYRDFRLNPPDFVKKCDVGDEAAMLYMGLMGEVLYIADEMSCYRRGAQVSWSANNYKSIDKMISHGRKMIETFMAFDEHSNRAYHAIMCDRIARQMAKTFLLEKQSWKFLCKKNREYFGYLSKNRKLFLVFGMIAPRLIQRIYIRRIKVLSASRGVG